MMMIVLNVGFVVNVEEALVEWTLNSYDLLARDRMYVRIVE